MVSRKDNSLQSISVQLDGKNYTYWSYFMKNFLREKSMWSYVTGVRIKPTDETTTNYANLVDSWETDNSKIITWINNSVTHFIGIQLDKYETAKEVWVHLARLYTQSNFAKQYQLETYICALQQNDMSVQEFYSAMSNLWDQLAFTESAELRIFEPYMARREEQRLVQFLMALRNDFEGLHGKILHRSPLPYVDSVVNELLAEEIRLKSKADKGSVTPTTPSIFVAQRESPPRNQNRPAPKVSPEECDFCKENGHWKAHCPRLLGKGKQQQQQ
ncbi:uncharacterized protein [Henckelia pumila]|uniref:uncharacterized protein n=1 Tax=Henckelia pumila TaxID=405737 RepID=UPI003C6E9C3A